MQKFTKEGSISENLYHGLFMVIPNVPTAKEEILCMKKKDSA